MGSLFENIPAELPNEIFQTICATKRMKIERIVSNGHASPEGFWYDQEGNEFVLVVKGSAGLKVEGEDDIVTLRAGDYFNIEPHVGTGSNGRMLPAKPSGLPFTTKIQVHGHVEKEDAVLQRQGWINGS